MHISRIQVPEFRVLKDIDISFEKEFIPRIFPLGSQNGGGKSTLLQLIFVLLHCATDPERIPYLQNMLQGFKIPEGSDQRLLASIDIWDGNKTNTIEFICCKNSFFLHFSPTLDDQSHHAKFTDLKKEYEQLKLKVSKNQENINITESFLEELSSIENDIDKDLFLRHLLPKFQATKIGFSEKKWSDMTFQEVREQVKETLAFFVSIHHELNKTKDLIEKTLALYEKYFYDNKLIYLCNYLFEYNQEDEEDFLVVRFNRINSHTTARKILKTLSSKVFLAAPASQVFLFLSKTARKILFKDIMIGNDYTSEVKQAKSKLSGFFTYDFVAVSLLTESFKTARDKDFAKAIETNGQYGNSYQTLVNNLHLILGNKKVNPNPNLSEIIFKLDNNDNIELYPEDLSHGELKRLSIYIWLKYHNIEDAIVLMDEIEIAFHPDWQYQIISDIQEWAPNNQYILATHSYELCQALTPSHVKEIEPKLLKQNAIN